MISRCFWALVCVFLCFLSVKSSLRSYWLPETKLKMSDETHSLTVALTRSSGEPQQSLSDQCKTTLCHQESGNFSGEKSDEGTDKRDETLLLEDWQTTLIETSEDPRLNEPICWKQLKCRAINCKKLIRLCLCDIYSQQVKERLKIYLPVQSVNSLIDGASPFAFTVVHEKIIEFAIQKAWDDLLYKQEAHIIVQSLDPRIKFDKEKIQVALRNSFFHEARMTNYTRIRTTAEGCASCRISIAALIVTLAVLIPLVVFYEANTETWVIPILGICIIIIWVTIWHPVEALLYGSFNSVNRTHICMVLANALVTVEMVHATALTRTGRILVRDNYQIV
jgi:hypothetical protein